MIDKHELLKVKAEIYNRYQRLPGQCEPFSLGIAPAEHGWIDITFSAAGVSRTTSLSCFPEPFVGIRQWLEDIIVCTDRLDFTLDVDCDHDSDTIIHFEHLYDLDNDGGLFYLYEAGSEGFLAGYINLHDFIKAIYTSILDYALEGEKTDAFRENWLEYVPSEDYPDGLLSSVFRSEIIETFLTLNNRYQTRRLFTQGY